MRKISPVAAFATAIAFVVLSTLVLAQALDLAKLVAPADVEKVTGLKGVTAMDTGALNEKTVASHMFMAGSKMVASVFAFKPNTFVGDKKHAVVGIGDEAFEANQGLAVTFRKHSTPVTVLGTAPQMNKDQVRALAKLIADRM